ncbi:MAG: hypothetical protein Q9161_008183 [Pseudevernia consocians]
MAEPYASLVAGLVDLLETGKLSDLKIVCGEKEFAVHKTIICCQSKPLMAMCTNGMKESQESVIDLTFDTEPCVSRLVDFLYRCDYDELDDDSEDASPDNRDTKNDTVAPWNEPASHSSNANTADSASATVLRQLSLHVDMYVLADKYDLDSLGVLAQQKFARAADQPGRTRKPVHLAVLETIPRIYAVTGEHNGNLREIVVEYVRLRRSGRSNRDPSPASTEKNGWFREQIAHLFQTVPGFALDVSRSWLQEPYLGYCDNDSCGRVARGPKFVCGPCQGGNAASPRGRNGGLQSLWALEEEYGQRRGGSWG